MMSKIPREAIVLLGAIVFTLLPSPFCLLPSALAAAPHPSLLTARATVTVGMTKDQVLRVMGEPTHKQGDFWVWVSADKQSAYGVTFKAGKVLRCGALQG